MNIQILHLLKLFKSGHQPIMITFSLEPNSASTNKPWKLQIWLSPKSQAIYYLHDPQEAQSILEFILAKNNHQNNQVKQQNELSFAGFIPRSLSFKQPLKANSCVAEFC